MGGGAGFVEVEPAGFAWSLVPVGDSAAQCGMAAPVTWPAFASFAKKYSGWCAKVTWSFPSLRLVVPTSDFESPWRATGAPLVRNGGQRAAHAPAQVFWSKT